MVLLAYNLADTYFVGLLNDPLQTGRYRWRTPKLYLMTAIATIC